MCLYRTKLYPAFKQNVAKRQTLVMLNETIKFRDFYC